MGSLSNMTGCWILDAGYPESRDKYPVSGNDYQRSNELYVRRV